MDVQRNLKQLKVMPFGAKTGIVQKKTRSIPWVLMPWDWQQWYWLDRINRPLSSMISTTYTISVSGIYRECKHVSLLHEINPAQLVLGLTIYIDGLAQDCCNSSTLAMELLNLALSHRCVILLTGLASIFQVYIGLLLGIEILTTKLIRNCFTLRR